MIYNEIFPTIVGRCLVKTDDLKVETVYFWVEKDDLLAETDDLRVNTDDLLAETDDLRAEADDLSSEQTIFRWNRRLGPKQTIFSHKRRSITRSG